MESEQVQSRATASSATCPVAKPNRKIALGLAFMGLSLLLRGGAAAFALIERDIHSAAIAAGVYVMGKVLFYVGLGVAGPDAVQRIPWVRRWRLARAANSRSTK